MEGPTSARTEEMAIALGMAAAKQLLPADQKLRKAHCLQLHCYTHATDLRAYQRMVASRLSKAKAKQRAAVSFALAFLSSEVHGSRRSAPGRLESSWAPIGWGPRPHDAAELGGPRSAGVASLNFEILNAPNF